MKRLTVGLVVVVAITAALFLSNQIAQTCCGQAVDFYNYTITPSIISPCAGNKSTISGSVWQDWWTGNEGEMWIVIKIADQTPTIVRQVEFQATKTGPGTPGGGYNERADYSFTWDWDGKNNTAVMVPIGTYDVTITAEVRMSGTVMVSATRSGQIATSTTEPCCVGGATVIIDPKTIDKARDGNPITAYLTLLSPYTMADISLAAIVKVNNVDITPIVAYQMSEEEGKVILKFSSPDLIAVLPSVPRDPAGSGHSGRLQNVPICLEVSFSDQTATCAGLCANVDVIDRRK